MIIPKEQIMWEVFCKFEQGYKLLDYTKRWQQPNGGEMTDKIIIDGVNVSECKYFCKFTGICRNEDIGRVVRPQCKNIRDCYYKQFKHKEQDCKSLKEENFIHKELIKRQEEQLDIYRIANAELEKENKELLKFKEMQEKELIELRTKLEYQEDRFCKCETCVYASTQNAI